MRPFRPFDLTEVHYRSYLQRIRDDVFDESAYQSDSICVFCVHKFYNFFLRLFEHTSDRIATVCQSALSFLEVPGYTPVGRTNKERNDELQPSDNHLTPTVDIHNAVLGFIRGTVSASSPIITFRLTIV